VAGEVKALAAQTAKATAEIGSQIDTVRIATSDAVTAMAEIGGIIGKINEVSAAIAAAVEEQNATTQEIAASVQAVSNATAGTAQAMEHVVAVADNTGTASRDVLTGAVQIGREAETLRTEVDQFLAHLIHCMAGIRWRAWYKRLGSLRDWVLTPLSMPGQNLPCPPTTTIGFCRSRCQVSARGRSQPLLTEAGSVPMAACYC
jgi:ABC-type transporter Mla subunit MlaD